MQLMKTFVCLVILYLINTVEYLEPDNLGTSDVLVFRKFRCFGILIIMLNMH